MARKEAIGEMIATAEDSLSISVFFNSNGMSTCVYTIIHGVHKAFIIMSLYSGIQIKVLSSL